MTAGGFSERLRISRWDTKANEKKTTGLWLLSKLQDQRRELVSKSSALGTRDMSLNIGLKEMSPHGVTDQLGYGNS
jgi:hypothetical protein